MTSDDDDIWAKVTQDVRPIAHNKAHLQKPISKKVIFEAMRQRHLDERPQLPSAHQFNTKKETPKYFEKMRMEARIDLHGLTCEEAGQTLDRFFYQMQCLGRRAVLVITGKGMPKPCNTIQNDGPYGVLRTYTCTWFEKNPYYIVCYSEARTEDGGLGAFYVHVRKSKDI
ncbi:MAG: hypothetical protein NEHIOOID_00059 [Holosporales bacterium]